MENTTTITAVTTTAVNDSNTDAAKVVSDPTSSHHRVKFIEGEYITEYLMLNNFGRDIMDKYPPLASYHKFNEGDRLTKADADLIIKRLSKVCTLSYKRKPYSGRKRWYFYVKKVVDSTLLDGKGRLKSNTLYTPISTEDNNVTNVANVTNNNNPENSNSEPDITTHTQLHINCHINRQNRKKYLSIILINNLIELFNENESEGQSFKGNNAELLKKGRVVKDSNNQPWVTMTSLAIMSSIIDGQLLNTPQSKLHSFLRPYINKCNQDIRDIIDNDNNIINLFNLEMGTNIYKIYRKTYGVYELSNDSSDSDEGGSFEYVRSMRILEEDYLDLAERKLCSLYQKCFHRQLKGSDRYRYFDYFYKVSMWVGADRKLNTNNKPVYTPIKDFVLEGSQLLGIDKEEHICALHSLDFTYKDKLEEFLSRYDVTQIINDYRGYMRHTLIEYVNKKLTENYHVTNDTNMYELLRKYRHNNTLKQLSQKQMIDYLTNYDLQNGYVPVIFSGAQDQRVKDIKELLLIEKQCVQEMENLYNYHQKLATFMGNIDTIIVPSTDDNGT